MFKENRMEILSNFVAKINNLKVYNQQHFEVLEEFVGLNKVYNLPDNRALYYELYNFIDSFLSNTSFASSLKLVEDTYYYSLEVGYLQFYVEGYEDYYPFENINQKITDILDGQYTEVYLTKEKDEIGIRHEEGYYTVWCEEEPYYICVGEEVINVTDLLNISESEFEMIIQNLQEPIMFNITNNYEVYLREHPMI